MKYFLLFLLFSQLAFPKDFIIFSIEHDFPMTKEEEDNLKKNFFINLGSDQGVQKGSVLAVYRTISELDPYENKKRYDYKVKIGELKVIHTEKSSSIARHIQNASVDEDSPLFEIRNLMIGDKVEVNLR
jgi:hypothetical protein